jgi:hypothetical protein
MASNATRTLNFIFGSNCYEALNTDFQPAHVPRSMSAASRPAPANNDVNALAAQAFSNHATPMQLRPAPETYQSSSSK